MSKQTQRNLAAVHEAGHAVVGYMRGQFVRERGLTIKANGTGNAHVKGDFPIPRVAYPANFRAGADAAHRTHMAFHVAGYVAEEMGRSIDGPASNRWWLSGDYQNAFSVWTTYWGMDGFDGDPEVMAAMSEAEALAATMLNRAGAWDAVQELAVLLKRRGGKVSSDEANEVLERLLPGSWLSSGERAGV